MPVGERGGPVGKEGQIRVFFFLEEPFNGPHCPFSLSIALGIPGA